MNVPKLRFPEFSGKWEDKRLGGVVDTITSGSRDWAQYYSDTGAKFIRMTNIPRDGVQLLLSDLKHVALPTTGSEGARTSLQGGDILVSITAELGKIGLVPDDLGESYINQHTALVRPSKSKIVPALLAQLLATKSSNKRLNRLNDSGAKAGLNLGTLRAFKVNLPTLPEQKKIAAFLGVVDAKIAALRARRDGLERYKRGLMQSLFSQTLRFTKPDGTAFPEWEEKRLGDLGAFRGGGTPDTNVSHYWTGDIPWISSSDVKEDDLTGPEIYRWITKAALKNSAAKIIPAGSILIVTRVGVGKLTVAPRDLCTSQDFTNFTPDKDVVLFLAYWMVANRDALLRLCQGTSIKGLTTEDLKTLIIPIPHPEEQQIIADALSAMDAKIAAVADQVTQMEAFKKGLLQQMFV